MCALLCNRVSDRWLRLEEQHRHDAAHELFVLQRPARPTLVKPRTWIAFLTSKASIPKVYTTFFNFRYDVSNLQIVQEGQI